MFFLAVFFGYFFLTCLRALSHAEMASARTHYLLAPSRRQQCVVIVVREYPHAHFASTRHDPRRVLEKKKKKKKKKKRRLFRSKSSLLSLSLFLVSFLAPTQQKTADMSSQACATVSVPSTSFSASLRRRVGSSSRGDLGLGRRHHQRRGRDRVGVVTTVALFGLSGRDKKGGESKISLTAIEAEIEAAPPSTSTAATTRLSLADAVWKISKDIPLSLRDRVVCTIAAEAVQALCETGLDGASLVRSGGGTLCAFHRVLLLELLSSLREKKDLCVVVHHHCHI